MKKLLTMALVAFMLLATTACSSGDKTSSTVADDVLNVEVTTAPVGMHPLKTNDAPSTLVNGQMFETLYLRTPDDTSYTPLLAEEMPIFSEDGLSATIKLRKDVTFQDGTPFTAEAVAYMIDSIKDPAYGSLRASIVESIESYEIVDDHTIVLHLSYVDGVLIAKLAHTNACIINPKMDKEKDLMMDAAGAGTGPYQFVSSVPGSSYSLEAYEGYWGEAPEVKKVQFDVVADESTALARLQTGEADLYTTVSADAVNTAKNISGYTLVAQETSAVYYLALRSNESAKHDIMQNPEFRKAVIQSIDFDTYIETMLGDLAARSQSIVGPKLVGYTEAMEQAGYRYDQEAAKAAIAANGWEGQTVTLFTATRDWQQDLAVYMQDQLSKVGINLEIVSEEWASFLATGKEEKKYDMIILSWSNVTGDGQQMLQPNFSTANGVRVKYNNAEFDEMVQASVLTTDMAERQAHMLDAVTKIQGDAVVTPVYSAKSVYVYNSDVYSNVTEDASTLFRLAEIKLVK